MGLPPDRPVLFFDGHCHLCNRAVRFVVRHDHRGCFLFAPLQSAAGRNLPVSMRSDGGSSGFVVLAFRGRYYRRSDAALHTFRLLGGLWPVFFAAIVLPRFLRDAVYNLVARNRYRWFGRNDTCMVPEPGLRERFLEEY
jgi:predicted DCC family thiol-disulfide oxidoreductase YuxK